MLTLALDAATYTGSVALLHGARVLAQRDVAMRGEREERLMPAVDATLREAGVTVRDLRRIVCGEGPGSFTSLRIAGSIAKGVALGLGVPLYAVSSLWLIVAGASPALPAGAYLAGLDAMRGDRYVQRIVVESDGGVRETEDPSLISSAAMAELAMRERVVGPGLATDLAPHARGATLLDLDAMRPIDLASWEPRYGRLAEAQVKWEAAHGRPLAAG
ncbi:MAG: tRNA (adenosine(37)-N6)-threonylcarbamoyltransferase complex dimerization subunit type 1 TsaB [Gemmatimonadota bacterium]|nr:tRNA (adenosine(37)-N6)-threonylcarbamoyltransferase complex dimerization subunit type 1 TsaB [Gemmatimonadota bacterium]